MDILKRKFGKNASNDQKDLHFARNIVKLRWLSKHFDKNYKNSKL